MGNSIYMSYGAEDRVECQARVARMEDWYFQDGRDQEDHSMRGLFTGLYQKYGAPAKTAGTPEPNDAQNH